MFQIPFDIFRFQNLPFPLCAFGWWLTFFFWFRLGTLGWILKVVGKLGEEIEQQKILWVLPSLRLTILKMGFFRRKVVFQPSIFQVQAVSLRDKQFCTIFPPTQFFLPKKKKTLERFCQTFGFTKTQQPFAEGWWSWWTRRMHNRFGDLITKEWTGKTIPIWAKRSVKCFLPWYVGNVGMWGCTILVAARCNFQKSCEMIWFSKDEQ